MLRPREEWEVWYRGVNEATDCFMARWHGGESERNRLRHASGDAKSGDKGKRELRGGGGGQPY